MPNVYKFRCISIVGADYNYPECHRRIDIHVCALISHKLSAMMSYFFNHILFPSQKPNKEQYNNIQSYRDGGLPEKQALIKLAAHYHIYMYC